MKKLSLQHILCLILLGVVLLGCEDTILNDKEPLDTRNEANFFQTEEDAMEALVAVYDILQWNSVQGFHPPQMLADIASDDAYAGGASRSDAPNIIQIDQHRIDVNNEQIYGLWKKYYWGIYRANLLLERIEGVEANDEFKARLTAEAQFLRGFYYFELVRFFENVPLILKPLSPDEYQQPQATPQDVYNQIALDLTEAQASLPSSSGDGRVSIWAAKSLLARVFLFYNGVYNANLQAGTETIDAGSARALIDEVVDNSGHDLVADYGTLFEPAGELSTESVFEIQYSNTFPWWDWGYVQGGEGNIAIQMQGPRVDDPAQEGYLRGWSFGTVTQGLYDAYEDVDPRRGMSIITMGEFNAGVTRGFQHTGFFTKKYTTKKSFAPTQGQTELNWGNNYHVIRFADVLLMGAELHLATGGGRAQGYLDRVRERVGLASVPATLPNILQERRVELALEGHRYFDLLRQGLSNADQAITITGAIGPGYEGEPTDFDVSFNAANRGFMPIPREEIDLLGGAISQNAGY